MGDNRGLLEPSYPPVPPLEPSYLLALSNISDKHVRSWMMAQLKAAAERLCGGRLVALHEGGYSELYGAWRYRAVRVW